ncbi:TOBE domain-containing protein [Microbacterium sp. SORGH_AS_0888]|uniref:TOBE domain-containing protein n=1 Tax=Microbacterium sp. SORGH_AS_0888 TaxID=3041791 RepID=UPI0027880BC9|nr:TOBE domain-containing protein [Microbacterium sp. SORGH_AS_0888]MDQ1131019.1 hypothetical protein [Microbacterium sp. SORGH_AS_0888]
MPLPAALGGGRGVGVRPEQLVLTTTGGVRARVTAALDEGSRAVIGVAFDDGETAAVEVSGYAEHPVVGQRVGVAVRGRILPAVTVSRL